MKNNSFLNTLKNRKTSIYFFILVLVCAVLLFWKAPFGMVQNDEPFMISLGHRFLKGDIPITQEWYRAQLIGIIYLPFIWFYINVFGTTEGLVLFCRYIFVIWWLLTGVVLFRRLKQYGSKTSFAVIIAFYLYVPFDIISLTYNVVSLSCLLLFFSYFLVKGNIVLDYLNGFVLAIAVIAYPLLIFLALFYGLSVIICNISGRFKNYNIFSVKKLLRVIIPCVVSAAILIAYILINSNMDRFFTGMLEVVKSNSAAQRSIVLVAKNLLSTFPFVFTLGLVVLVFSLIDKKRYQRTIIYFSLQSVVFCISIVYILLNFMYLNVIMFPISFLGLQAFILNKRKNWHLFICLWITGVLFGIVCYLSSDTGNMAIANGMVLSSLSGFVFIGDYYTENKSSSGIKHNKLIFFVCFLIAAFQIGGELSIKVFRSYKTVLQDLNYKISVGAEKGIITTQKQYIEYEAMFNDIQSIRHQKTNERSFLSVSLYPLAYIDMDYSYSTYSPWMFVNNKPDFKTESKQLEKYYELFPDRIPGVIFSSLGPNHLKNELQCIDYSQYKEYELPSGLWLIKCTGEKDENSKY